MRRYTVRELIEDRGEDFAFEVLSDDSTLEQVIATFDVHRPGLALAGYTDYFLDERIQILGETEISYLGTLSEEDQAAAIERFVSFPLICAIVTKSLEPPTGLMDRLKLGGAAVLRTPLDTTPFIHDLTGHLTEVFSPTTTLHGSMVDVYGVGLLITGRSGIGKSECALDLVERGHRLVSDDVVTIIKRRDDILIGTGNELLMHHMELRGIGIIDIRTMFGIKAVRSMKRLEVEVRLEEPQEDAIGPERLGLDDAKSEILGVSIPRATVSIYPGKNLSVLSEVIALNYLQKAYGQHPAKELDKRLKEWMEKQAELKRTHHQDLE